MSYQQLNIYNQLMFIHFSFVQPHQVVLLPRIKTKQNKDTPQMHFTTSSLQSDTQYLPVSSESPTKDGERHEEQEREKKEQESEREGRRRKWGGIDKWLKMYCSCFMSWWKKTRQGTRQTARYSSTVKLQGAAMHKMHTSGEKNGEKQVGIAN